MSKLSEEELEKIAAEELLKEAKVLGALAEKEGPSAWTTRRIARTNKVFLRQTLKNAISSNRYVFDKSRKKK